MSAKTRRVVLGFMVALFWFVSAGIIIFGVKVLQFEAVPGATFFITGVCCVSTSVLVTWMVVACRWPRPGETQP